MENQMQLIEMNDNQRRVYLDTVQLHEAYMDAFVKSQAYRGGMHWKRAKGKEYLFRSLDRFGYGKSLGPRCRETESTYLEFHSQKEKLRGRLRHVKERLKEQARFCRAARITRVPRTATAVLRLLEQHRLLGSNLQIIGTNALYAYEARAGVFLQQGLLATQDMDLLLNVRARLRLVAVDDISSKGLIDILRKADRSFDLTGGKSFRAVNRAGYMVDLVKPEPKSLLTVEKRQLGSGADDLMAAEIRNLQWLISSPKVEQVVIGEDGYPATMVVPDPRAFATHKLWLSRQADRDTVKKKRDLHQAYAVCGLILQYLPEHEFNKQELRMFPQVLIEDIMEALNDVELPPGYGE